MSFSLKTTSQSNEPLSSQQRKLHILIDKIEHQKLQLIQWENAKNDIQQYAHKGLVPVYEELHEVLFEQLEQLWNSLSKTDFKKSDLVKIDEKIRHLANSIKKSKSLSEQQLLKVKDIFQFYEQLELSNKSEKVKNNLAIKIQNLDDDERNLDTNNDHAFDEWDNEQYQKIREQAKLKKQQEKREQASKLVEQSLKTVYLKIASSIHPDREQDEAKKIEKTILFQRANEAYEQQDLFFLLKMQIQVEQDVASTKKGLSDETIKFYKLALEAQSQKLQSQIDDIIHALVWSEKAKITVKKSQGQLNISDLYKQIDADTFTIKQQLKAEKERLKYMSKESGLVMLLEHGVL